MRLRWRSTQTVEPLATVTYTLYTAAGAAVTGATSIAMACVDTARGNYMGLLSASVSLTNGASYYIIITATASGTTYTRKIDCVAGYAE